MHLASKSHQVSVFEMQKEMIESKDKRSRLVVERGRWS